MFQRRQKHGGLKEPEDNYKRKRCRSVITYIKKHLSEQVLPITYTLDKSFFAVATFEGL